VRRSRLPATECPTVSRARRNLQCFLVGILLRRSVVASYRAAYQGSLAGIRRRRVDAFNIPGETSAALREGRHSIPSPRAGSLSSGVVGLTVVIGVCVKKAPPWMNWPCYSTPSTESSRQATRDWRRQCGGETRLGTRRLWIVMTLGAGRSESAAVATRKHCRFARARDTVGHSVAGSRDASPRRRRVDLLLDIAEAVLRCRLKIYRFATGTRSSNSVLRALSARGRAD